MNDSALTLLEARQLLGAVRQANELIIETLMARLTGVTATTVAHLDTRILAAIRNHREAIAGLWEPAAESGISAAARKSQSRDVGAFGSDGTDSHESVSP